MTYIVFIGSTMDSSFDTLADAECRVAEICGKYQFVNPDIIHIRQM